MNPVKSIMTQLIFTLMIYAIGMLIIALSIYPGVLFCFNIWQGGAEITLSLRVLFLCLGIMGGYFTYGICLMFLVGICRWLFRLNLEEGAFAPDSSQALRWGFVSALGLIVSSTVMDFILLTPLVGIYFRWMGAKVGKNVQINSKYCSDLGLLEIGDHSIIGGHATVIAHSVENGRLILKKVKIGKNVVIGLNSVILPGVQIGDGAVIAAGAVLLKNTFVEPGSFYAGVPAVPANKGQLITK